MNKYLSNIGLLASISAILALSVYDEGPTGPYTYSRFTGQKVGESLCRAIGNHCLSHLLVGTAYYALGFNAKEIVFFPSANVYPQYYCIIEQSPIPAPDYTKAKP